MPGQLSDLKPGMQAITRVVLAHSELQISSTTGGQHSSGSWHYTGEAVDLIGLGPSMFNACEWIKESGLFKVLGQGIHKPNLSIGHGRFVDPIGYWTREVWDEHVDHIHLGYKGPVPVNIGDLFGAIGPVAIGGHPLTGPEGAGERKWDYSPSVRSSARAYAGHAHVIDTAGRNVLQKLARWRLPR